MAQQQVLLIILGAIIVGIALAIGITMFTDNSTSANRDAITSDLAKLAARAQMYYRRPKLMGGGGRSFTSMTINDLTAKPQNTYGTYSVTSVAADQVVLDAVGIESGSNGSKLSVTMTVFPESTHVVANN
jgi:Tfp pilus assembly protein PilE